ERAQEVASGIGNLLDRAGKRRLVGPGGVRKTAELAHELERGGADLILGRGRLEVEQRADIAAHRSLLLADEPDMDRAPQGIIIISALKKKCPMPFGSLEPSRRLPRDQKRCAQKETGGREAAQLITPRGEEPQSGSASSAAGPRVIKTLR